MRKTWLQMAQQLAAKHRAEKGAAPFRAEVSGGRGSLHLYDTIGEDWFFGGVTAKGVADALADMKGVAGLDIYINSPGGDIFEAKAIYSQLRRFEGEKVVHVDGIAASAATLIAMAGDRIITAPLATWMIHEVWAVAMGRASDMLEMAALLEKENATFAETYASRTGQSTEDVLAWMSAETWMNAAEAKARGFTDEISEEQQPSENDDDRIAAALDQTIEKFRAHAA